MDGDHQYTIGQNNFWNIHAVSELFMPFIQIAFQTLRFYSNGVQQSNMVWYLDSGQKQNIVGSCIIMFDRKAWSLVFLKISLKDSFC